MATGWLGWSHTEAMETPVAAIFVAQEGKVDFVKKTNPYGSGDDKKGKATTAEGMKRILRAARPPAER